MVWGSTLQAQNTFSNPVIYSDVPDMDAVRVGNDYWMVSTTMHFSPGAPIMHSTDLVHWEIVNYIFDTLNDSPKNNLNLTAAEFADYCEESGYYPLNMTPKHTLTAEKLDVSKLDKMHRDPFDRLLLAQAKAENYSFLTHDAKLPLYEEKCVIKV